MPRRARGPEEEIRTGRRQSYYSSTSAIPDRPSSRSSRTFRSRDLGSALAGEDHVSCVRCVSCVSCVSRRAGATGRGSWFELGERREEERNHPSPAGRGGAGPLHRAACEALRGRSRTRHGGLSLFFSAVSCFFSAAAAAVEGAARGAGSSPRSGSGAPGLWLAQLFSCLVCFRDDL